MLWLKVHMKEVKDYLIYFMQCEYLLSWGTINI